MADEWQTHGIPIVGRMGEGDIFRFATVWPAPVSQWYVSVRDAPSTLSAQFRVARNHITSVYEIFSCESHIVEAIRHGPNGTYARYA